MVEKCLTLKQLHEKREMKGGEAEQIQTNEWDAVWSKKRPFRWYGNDPKTIIQDQCIRRGAVCQRLEENLKWDIAYRTTPS